MDEYPGPAIRSDLSWLAREAGFTKLSSQYHNMLAYLIFRSPDGLPVVELLEDYEDDSDTLQSDTTEV